MLIIVLIFIIVLMFILKLMPVLMFILVPVCFLTPWQGHSLAVQKWQQLAPSKETKEKAQTIEARPAGVHADGCPAADRRPLESYGETGHRDP